MILFMILFGILYAMYFVLVFTVRALLWLTIFTIMLIYKGVQAWRNRSRDP